MAELAILLFISIFLLILYGFPVAFTLGGISTLYAFCFLKWSDFLILPSRILQVMGNTPLLAVPLFIYMGMMLEKSGLAESLLETMAMLFGKVKGGLAISVVVVGALLAASTGIVGATVITMGLISLPTMLNRGYQPELATGTIAAVSVGDLFKAALLPGVLLVVCYIIYILIFAYRNPELAPSIPAKEIEEFRKKDFGKKIFRAFFLPLLLIIAVLGSILGGIATPTEAAGIGALGATILTFVQGKFNLKIVEDVGKQTAHLTTMVFVILLGATTFTFVFRMFGGDDYLIELITGSNLSPYMFLFLVMLVIFIAGFFIDFIEIIFIIVPVVAPIFSEVYEMDLIWIGILIALNLQTSFLSPPFGFSLFYLKGVAPPQVTTAHLYRGIIPFVIIQIIFLALVVLFPKLVFLI